MRRGKAVPIILIGAHFLADFTLQPRRLAELKSRKLSFLLLHGLIHAAVMAALGFACVEGQAFIEPWAIIALSHIAIDIIRQSVDRRFKSGNEQSGSFLADQVVHLAIIIGVCHRFGLNGHITPALERAVNTEGLRQYIGNP